MRPARSTLLALFLAACSNGTARPPSASPIAVPSATPLAPARRVERPTTKERALADAYAGALTAPLTTLGPMLEYDVHAAFPGLPDTVGRDRVVALHSLLFGAFDQRRFALRRVLKTGGAQALEWTFSGVMARDWMQLPATRGPATFEGLTLLFTTDEGTITDVHVYFDVARAKAALGGGPKALAGMPPPPAPPSAPEVIEQQGSSVEAGDVAIVRASLDALEARDLPRYLSTMADDVAISTPEAAEPARGKAAARAYYEKMHASVDQLDTTIENEWGVGSYVVVEYTIAGLQSGPVGWVATAHDRVLTLHVTDVVELRDEHIAKVTRYENPGEIAADEP